MFYKANVKFLLSVGVPVLLFGLMASCAKTTNSKDLEIASAVPEGAQNVVRATGSPTASPTPSPTPVIPLDAKAAMLMLRENCHSCHGMGKDKSSFWQTPPEFEHPTAAELEVLKAEAVAKNQPAPTVEAFEKVLDSTTNIEKIITRMETDQFSVEVFQSIENKLLADKGTIVAKDAKPKPMRPNMDDGSRARFVALMDKLLSPAPVPPATPTPLPAGAVAPLSLSEAKSWCVGCHSPGGSAASVWDKANGTEQDWRDFAAKAKDSVAAKRMPGDKLKPAEYDQWLRLLVFFQRRMPTVVMEARGKYHGNKVELGVPVDANYKCNQTRTAREFVNELTLNALNRPPTAAELALVPNSSSPVTLDTRRSLVNRLSNEWRTEFLNNGVKKFADKVSSAEKTKASALSNNQNFKNDISGEFYQQIRATIAANKSYKEALMSNKVFATKLTAPFYNASCVTATASLADGAYAECDLTADNSPRKTFFTTLGFLFAKSSSVFQENNNYGRVASMNEVIRGEPLKANTAGETGETINPLPSCLKSNDWRVMLQGENLAPRGTMTVPASGNFCQGCHIRRNLAAGSIVFRPFGPMGEVLRYSEIQTLRAREAVGDTTLLEHEKLLLNQINAAINPSLWAHLPPGVAASNREVIGVNYFAGLFNVGKNAGQEVGCVVDPITGATSTVSSVPELAQHLLADEMELPRGLARIIPRALSNRNSTNPEVIEAITGAWKESNGQVLQLLQAYFLTDTYACKNESGGM